MMSGSSPDRNRVLWRCRRGTRETDLLLQAFTARYYDQLDVPLRMHFVALLNEADLDIMAWVMGTRHAPQHYRPVIRLLQQFSDAHVCTSPSSTDPG